MAVTDYIGIRGIDGEEPLQGIGGGGTFTMSGDGQGTLTTPSESTGSASVDSSLTDLFKKAFLMPPEGESEGDGEDGDALVSILDQRLSDLAYVDTEIDFGAFRAHIKGKMIEYGG